MNVLWFVLDHLYRPLYTLPIVRMFYFFFFSSGEEECSLLTKYVSLHSSQRTRNPWRSETSRPRRLLFDIVQQARGLLRSVRGLVLRSDCCCRRRRSVSPSPGWRKVPRQSQLVAQFVGLPPIRNMADSQEDKLYKAEYAKSGRASCKKCKENIAKDSLRMAIMVQVKGSELHNSGRLEKLLLPLATSRLDCGLDLALRGRVALMANGKWRYAGLWIRFRFSRDGPSLAFKWSSLFLHKEPKIAPCDVSSPSEKCG